MVEFISIQHIDYLQRQGLEPPSLPARANIGEVPPALRRMVRVDGIGRLGSKAGAGTTAGAHTAGHRDRAEIGEDLGIGLYGYKIPLIYIIHGCPDGVGVYLGTWDQHNAERAEAHQGVIATVLQGLYPAASLSAQAPPLTRMDFAGLVLGIPTIKPPAFGDETLPWDRVIRAMAGGTWTVMVLAQPVHEEATNDLRHQVLNEMRAVGAMQQAERAPSPLSQHYHDLLQAYLTQLLHGLAVGAWRTAIYLLADEASYYRLASVWRGVFSGVQSQQEPIAVWDNAQVLQWASAWAMPDYVPPEGPGRYRHPFQYQTLLTSSQLAAYVHLPSLETPGFQISVIPDFDVVPPQVDGDRPVSLGQVIHQTRRTQIPYKLSPETLGRHTLIAGITGSGKTNTVFHLLRQLWQHRVPFLVLEPAKTEYRALLADANLRSDLRVYTVGNETIAPLRINPLAVEEGGSVATHIDLLKSVFNASFGMWTPLPQVLERCLHAVYADFGWDLVQGSNQRLGPDTDDSARTAAFPTLTDLYEKADEVVDQLGYDSKVTSDLRAALLTRLHSLRIGGKGVMLDTKLSLPMEELLMHPTIIELEHVGDDDEKAFLMGLLLVNLYEHLRSCGHTEGVGLRHLVVVEEAHRLLANVPPSGDLEQANAKGKAVETFVNMLSEVRAYGEAFVIAEQIPTKLAPDVIKNTNVKVVHRMVAADDREALRLTMNMDVEQSAALATFHVGQAAVFSEGDDRPVFVQVPYAKLEEPPELRGRRASDRVVTDHMRQALRQPKLARYYAPFDFYPNAPVGLQQFDDEVKAILRQRDVKDQLAAYALSLVTCGAELFARTETLMRLIRIHLPQSAVPDDALRGVLLQGARWYTTVWGRFYYWPYKTLALLQEDLAHIALGALGAVLGETGDLETLRGRLQRFQNTYLEACRRYYDPYEACSTICPSGYCLFRYHNQRLLRDRRLLKLFDQELAQAGKERSWPKGSAVQSVAAQLVGPSASAVVQRSAGLCFGIQRITTHPDILSTRRSAAIEALLQSWDGAKMEGSQ